MSETQLFVPLDRSRPGDGWALERDSGLSDEFDSKVLGWRLRKPKQ